MRSGGAWPWLLLVALAAFGFGMSASAASGPGTNIGNAEVLTGSASGSITSKYDTDFYVVYPSSTASEVTITVTNTTTGTDPACGLLIASVLDTNGASLDKQDITQSKNYEFAFSGSDRYFVEINNNTCDPGTGSPTKYTVQATGGSGQPLQGSVQSDAPGTSIGNAQPLTAHVAYSGTIPDANTEDWLSVHDNGTSGQVTIRVENTTDINPPPTCGELVVAVYNHLGISLSNIDLAPDAAHTFTVSSAGTYYVSVINNNCDPGDTPVPSYLVQADPAGIVDTPATPPQEAITGGPTMASAVGPLAGGVAYTDSIPGPSTTRWYAFTLANSGPATINVSNTTAFRATCGELIDRLYNSSGTSINGTDQADDTGVDFSLSSPGTYYISVDDNNCTPDNSPPLTLQITATPAAAFTETAPSNTTTSTTTTPPQSPPPAEQETTSSTSQTLNAGITTQQSTTTPTPLTGSCSHVAAKVAVGQKATIHLVCTVTGGTITGYTLVTQPTRGKVLSFNATTGVLVYQPNTGTAGHSDSFVYNAQASNGVELKAIDGGEVNVTIVAAKAAKTGGKGKSKGKSKGQTRAQLKANLRDNIDFLKKSIPELKALKGNYDTFQKVYNFAKGKLEKNPTVAANHLLQGLAEIPNVLQTGVDDDIDHLVTLEQQSLKADQALLDAINQGTKNLAPLQAKVNQAARAAAGGNNTFALQAHKSLAGFQAGIKLVTNWLLNDTSLKNSPAQPVIKQAVDVVLGWMKQVADGLRNQAVTQTHGP